MLMREAKGPIGRRGGPKAGPEPPEWIAWSDRAICSRACGGQCCKGSIIPISADEAERLLELAGALGVDPPGIVPAASVGVRSAGSSPPEGGVRSAGFSPPGGGGTERVLLMQARPCTFLNKDNLCRIYADRPTHCRNFPDRLRESCALSVKHFGDL